MKGICIVALVSIIVPMVRTNAALGADVHKVPPELTSAATSAGQTTAPTAGVPQVAERLDFSDYTSGPIEEWLESKGFKLEEAAKNREALDLSVKDGALILEAKEQLRGFLFKESLEINRFSKVRIEWGVIKYPEGASYEGKVKNEALMVYFFFGRDKLPSGHFALPDLPYFIGLFLCQHDKLNTPYLGAYYQEGGRFVCLGHPQPQQTIVSEFDLVTAFRQYFEKSDVPFISGISLGVDTSSSNDGGKATAFIKKIEVLE
jgi:hypothetical protein